MTKPKTPVSVSHTAPRKAATSEPIPTVPPIERNLGEMLPNREIAEARDGQNHGEEQRDNDEHESELHQGPFSSESVATLLRG
jgi:hypothetical protein